MTGKKLEFKKDLITLDVSFKSQDILFETIGQKLYEAGYVKASFAKALAERESSFPTGLATEPFPIAMPHTDSIHVNKEAIACIRLTEPVEFDDMGGSGNKIKAKFVFVLCLLQPEKQIESLSTLIEIVSNKNLMEKVAAAKDSSEVYSLLSA